MNKTKIFAAILTIVTLFTASCTTETTKDPDPVDKSVKVVTGTLTGSITWSKDTIYKLSGFVRVGSDDGTTIDNAGGAKGTLTIEAGTLIVGEKSSKGTLIIQRGSKIIAEGTASSPIVFTSEKSEGSKAAGDWGGLVICGLAPINIAGGKAELEGGYGGYFGGNDPADNSGILKYVRVEYAGVPINPNQEINSFTFGGVGNGTTLSYLQASYGGDDSFEWFGGTVNADHLIAYRGTDDDFDTDNGFSGHIQFGLGIRDKNIADFGPSGASNGFESDNDANSSINAPFTAVEFSNMTMVGPKKDTATAIATPFRNGALVRRNTKHKIFNSVIIGYPNAISVDGNTTVANAQDASLQIRNSVIAGTNGTNGYGFFVLGDVNVPTATTTWNTTTWATPKDWFIDGTFGNSISPRWDALGIDGSIFEAGVTPTLTLSGGSPLLTGANFTGLSSAFTTVAFKGAFGSTDWTTGWVEWNPQIKKYL
ncbi:MAG TPA: hypothetical protein PLS10_01415 [Chitinophagales bacterium]|nr:hypothetical protein [Chitinophagales bacterium]